MVLSKRSTCPLLRMGVSIPVKLPILRFVGEFSPLGFTRPENLSFAMLFYPAAATCFASKLFFLSVEKFCENLTGVNISVIFRLGFTSGDSRKRIDGLGVIFWSVSGSVILTWFECFLTELYYFVAFNVIGPFCSGSVKPKLGYLCLVVPPLYCL